MDFFIVFCIIVVELVQFKQMPYQVSDCKKAGQTTQKLQ